MLGLYNSEIRFDRTDKGKPILRHSLLMSSQCTQTDCERFNINISHSGRWVVCAGDCDMPVGIDVNDYGMRRNSIMDFKLCDQDPTLEAQYRQMAADFLESFVGPYGSIFAPAELVHMRALMADPSCTAEQQLLTFSRYWTCKESYVKVFGDGLGFDVSRLCFDFSDTPSADLPFLNPETSSSSVCSHFLPLRGLRFTVDGHSPPPGWRFEQIRLDRNHLCTVATAPPPPSVAERHDPPSELHVWNVPKMLSILLDAEDPIGF